MPVIVQDGGRLCTDIGLVCAARLLPAWKDVKNGVWRNRGVILHVTSCEYKLYHGLLAFITAQYGSAIRPDGAVPLSLPCRAYTWFSGGMTQQKCHFWRRDPSLLLGLASGWSCIRRLGSFVRDRMSAIDRREQESKCSSGVAHLIAINMSQHPVEKNSLHEIMIGQKYRLLLGGSSCTVAGIWHMSHTGTARLSLATAG